MNLRKTFSYFLSALSCVQGKSKFPVPRATLSEISVGYWGQDITSLNVMLSEWKEIYFRAS